MKFTRKDKKKQDNVPMLIDEANAIGQAVGAKECLRFTEILKKYQSGKANLEKKIKDNEQYFKMRQWGFKDDRGNWCRTKSTAWLFSLLQSRHADVMDNYPTCNILPRQKDDVGEAAILSEIIPVILKQNEYERVYEECALYGLKQGGSAQAVVWDATKHNGLGDIEIKKIDFLSLYWEPLITDIQDSPYVFITELVDKDKLEAIYPQTQGKLAGNAITPAKYFYDENVSTEDKAVVVDVYYKKVVNGKSILHYCKYTGTTVLFATENDPVLSERGLYDHGKYPIVITSLNTIEGSLIGYGLIDIGRDCQDDIDELNAAILDNAQDGTLPRVFAKLSAGINEEEYLDRKRKVIHFEGDSTGIVPVDTKPLGGVYVNVLNQKIDELKYTTANQDSNNGVAPSGVTSASGIAALQETGGKVARKTNMCFHRAFREVVYLVIELIRQFYELPREFRIAPSATEEAFVPYDNRNIKPQHMVNNGVDMGMRVPEFDIEVTTEKQSPYKKMEMNDLALQFYNLGFFIPDNATQASACLELMDFGKKREVMDVVKRNGDIYEQLLQMEKIALTYASQADPIGAQKLAEIISAQAGNAMPTSKASADVTLENSKEHPFVEKARANAQASTESE